MLHAHDGCYMLTMLTRERERESEREREGPKLVIFLTSCLCKYWQNLSRKGYPPLGVGDRNNNPARDSNNKNIFVPDEQHPLEPHLHHHHRHLHRHHDTLDTTFLLHLYYGYYIYTLDTTFILWILHWSSSWSSSSSSSLILHLYFGYIIIIIIWTDSLDTTRLLCILHWY